jgi:hypothetical protein
MRGGLMGSVIEDRLDHVDTELLERKAEHKAITARLDRRRHWWVSLILALAVGLGALAAGGYLTFQSLTHELHHLEASRCEATRIGREGNRAGWIALLEARSPANPAQPLIPEGSPLRHILQDDVLAKLPPITC